MALFNTKQKAEAPPLEEVSTLARLLHHQAAAAGLLLAAALSAFLMANTQAPLFGIPMSQLYKDLWHLELGLSLHHVEIAKPLHLWINDGLMSIFFFLVGLEIKRELLVGELASFRKALLPIAAAAGGMLFPALVYTAINWNGDGGHGWGIPMATDIAFSAGVLGLLSKRVPSTLAVFLIALAIVDDLGSVLVIAVFYTDTIATRPLFIGLGLIVFSGFISFLGVRNAVVYTFLFCVIWAEFLTSGVHATIAGVLFAFTIPADASYDTPLFMHRIKTLLSRFDEAEDHANPRLVNARQQRLVRAIETECIHVEAPLQRIENKLHPFTAYGIMPLFAFANSGVQVDFAHLGGLLFQPVTLGVFFGLLAGKQMGIMSCTWLTVKSGLAELPQGVSWRQIYGLSWLAGIGFTMSLFIGELAFSGGGHGAATEAGAHHLAEAKVATLCASLIAGAVGSVVLLTGPRSPQAPESGAH